MAGEWETRALVELCDSVDYGYTASAKESPIGPKFLRITDIVPGSINWDSVPFCEIAQSLHDKFRLHDGDVVIARTGATTGYSAFIAKPPDAVFASYLVRLKVSKTNDPRFIAYFLKSHQFWAYMRGVLGDKSAQPNASAATMVRATLHVPSLKEQQAIAHVLGALDDKTELNRRMNQTLEGIARAIFKSWFVDFDPVRAKAAGHKPAGLAPAIAALFPDSFEDSELGEIPKGWRVANLGTVVAEARDAVQPADIERGTPYIALEHMPRRSVAISSWGVADEIASGKLHFRTGDILFGKLRPYFHKVGPAPLNGVCSTDIVVSRPKSDEWYGFALCHISSDDFVAHTDRGSTGTKMPRTNWRDMSAYKIVLPTAAVARRFTELVRPMFDRIRASIFEQATLAALRDALLPKLMSGELRVQSAERIVERAL